MRLSEKQAEFTRDWAAFLPYAIRWGLRHGYLVISEEGSRPVDANYGHPHSTHKMKLAHHLLLITIRDGDFIEDSSEYEPLGKAWEELHEDNRWGGRFSTPDGCHFSRTHAGVA